MVSGLIKRVGVELLREGFSYFLLLICGSSLGTILIGMLRTLLWILLAGGLGFSMTVTSTLNETKGFFRMLLGITFNPVPASFPVSVIEDFPDWSCLSPADTTCMS